MLLRNVTKLSTRNCQCISIDCFSITSAATPNLATSVNGHEQSSKLRRTTYTLNAIRTTERLTLCSLDNKDSFGAGEGLLLSQLDAKMLEWLGALVWGAQTVKEVLNREQRYYDAEKGHKLRDISVILLHQYHFSGRYSRTPFQDLQSQELQHRRVPLPLPGSHHIHKIQLFMLLSVFSCHTKKVVSTSVVWF